MRSQVPLRPLFTNCHGAMVAGARSLSLRSEARSYLANEFGRPIQAVQEHIVALGFRGGKSAVGEGQERKVRGGFANLARQVDALLRGECVAGNRHGRPMQPTEIGELVCLLRLWPCRNNLKSGEIQDLA